MEHRISPYRIRMRYLSGGGSIFAICTERNITLQPVIHLHRQSLGILKEDIGILKKSQHILKKEKR